MPANDPSKVRNKTQRLITSLNDARQYKGRFHRSEHGLVASSKKAFLEQMLAEISDALFHYTPFRDKHCVMI